MNKQKGFSLPRGWGYASLASLLFTLTWAWSVRIENSLGISDFSTGWVLFFVIALLTLFGARKRLSFLPLGPASRWLRIHVAGGFMAVFMFWLHTDEVCSISIRNYRTVNGSFFSEPADPYKNGSYL
jgi:hypothetical protein